MHVTFSKLGYVVALKLVNFSDLIGSGGLMKGNPRSVQAQVTRSSGAIGLPLNINIRLFTKGFPNLPERSHFKHNVTDPAYGEFFENLTPGETYFGRASRKSTIENQIDPPTSTDINLGSVDLGKNDLSY